MKNNAIILMIFMLCTVDLQAQKNLDERDLKYKELVQRSKPRSQKKSKRYPRRYIYMNARWNARPKKWKSKGRVAYEAGRYGVHE